MNNPIIIKPGSFVQGSEEWLKWRTAGIGGTDAAAIIGASKWDTPLSVFQKKTEPAAAKAQTTYQEWGNRLEPLLVDKFVQEHDLIAMHIDRGLMYYDNVEPWMKVSLDAEYHYGGQDFIIECKTGRSASDWDPVPEGYYAQAHWQMLVTGMRKVWFSVLIGGVDWFEREVDYDEQYAHNMYDKCKDFWEKLQQGIRPPISNNPEKDSEALLALRRGKTYGKTAEADKTAYAQFLLAKEQFNKAEQQFQTAKARLIYAMSDADALTYEGSRIASYVERAGSTSIDKELLKSIAPDIYQRVLKRGAPVNYIKFG